MLPRLSRRTFTRLLCLAGVPNVGRGASLLVQVAGGGKSLGEFAHPGMLHSAGDLRRMREAVGERRQPIYAGFEKLRDHPHSQLTYKAAGALEEVSRNPTVGANRLENDSNAAYQLALMGHITGDSQYFKRCAGILEDWAVTLKRITGEDAILCAGLAPFKLANAAELLRAGDRSWAQASAVRFGQFLRGVVLPVVGNFAAFANGNWDTAALKTMMAIAIFTEDRALFDRALVYYMHGCGDGRLDHYIYANGQCQESGRDQQHTQLGLAHMGDCCEMAWNQGLDLYGMMNNRLLLGFEYTARYEVGEEVAFVADLDQTGKYRHSVISPRSPLRPVYEQIYNHYANRRGLPAPWTAKAAAQVRPEGTGQTGADHTGFGTLLYTRDAGEPIEVVPFARPSGVYASAVDGVVRVSWIPLRSGGSYSLLRTGKGKAVSLPVAGGVAVQDDHDVVAGEVYEYRLEGAHGARDSDAVSVVAGLPDGWSLSSLGEMLSESRAFCAGSLWRMSAGAGKDAAVTGGGLAFLARMLSPREVMFSARLLPLFASQALAAGVACMGEDGACSVLMLAPGKGIDGEHIAWTVRLLTRPDRESHFSAQGEAVLAEPAVRYGRLYSPLSFRFRKVDAVWKAELSSDGESWKEVGKCGPLQGRLRAGMVMTSGIADVSTEVMWDGVTAAGSLKPGGAAGQ